MHSVPLQNFCAGTKNNFTECKSSLCLAHMFVTAAIYKYFFGLAQTIWTSPKHFGTCKRTRHYKFQLNMTNEYVVNDWKLTESVWNSFMLIKLVYHIFRQHKSKSKFFSLKVAIFTPLLKTINHCTAVTVTAAEGCC